LLGTTIIRIKLHVRAPQVVMSFTSVYPASWVKPHPLTEQAECLKAGFPY
jgi:hypothetical protein